MDTRCFYGLPVMLVPLLGGSFVLAVRAGCVRICECITTACNEDAGTRRQFDQIGGLPETVPCSQRDDSLLCSISGVERLGHDRVPRVGKRSGHHLRKPQIFLQSGEAPCTAWQCMHSMSIFHMDLPSRLAFFRGCLHARSRLLSLGHLLSRWRL